MSALRNWGSMTLTAAALAAACTSTARAEQFAEIPTDGKFDYQLHERYAAAEDVTIISSDGDVSADPTRSVAGNALQAGFNICYLNVLQSQPDDRDFWINEHSDLIVGGGSVVDAEWPDEMIFDISTPEKRAALLQIEIPWIEQCAAKGFSAIEPDNMDSFQRANGAFDAAASAEFMRAFVAEAHQRYMLVGQKNVAEWSKRTADGSDNLSKYVGFDFVVVEECIITGECPQLVDYYTAGRVFDVEYWYDEDYTVEGTSITIPAHTRDHFDTACAQLPAGVRVVLRNRDVRPASSPGFQYAGCVAPNPAGPGTADGETSVEQTDTQTAPETQTAPGDGDEQETDGLPEDTEP